MKKYSNYKSNYDKFPVVSVTPDSENMCWSGWSAITARLRTELDIVKKLSLIHI